MQSSSTQDPEILAQFAQSQNRIRSMALIHEQLCETSLSAAVDLREYLSRLVEGLMHSFDQEPIAFELDLDACTCGIDDALTCGLITNELVTNSIKHAFEGPAGGRIVVSLRSSEGTRILGVADDGRGLAVDIGGASSLGLSLVKTLVRQLNGELHVLEGPGTRIEIRFPAETPTGDAAA